jgi:hypothetical protein
MLMEVGVNARWPVPDTVTARVCNGRQHRSSRHMAAIQSVHAKRIELPSRHLPSRAQTEHAILENPSPSFVFGKPTRNSCGL